MLFLRGNMQMTGFWSYARHDMSGQNHKLEEIRKYMERRIGQRLGLRADFKIWRDQVDIIHGQEWSSETSDQISKSIVFFAIISPNWICSPRCHQELQEFRRLPKMTTTQRPRVVLPIYLYSSKLFENIPADLSEEIREMMIFIKTLDYVDWTSIGDLIEDEGLESREVKTKARELAEAVAKSLQKEERPQTIRDVRTQSPYARRLPVAIWEIDRPVGPARIDIDRSPNLMSPERVLVRPECFFSMTEVHTKKYVFPVALVRARVRVDVLGGVIDQNSINKSPIAETNNSSIDYLGAQEWDLRSYDGRHIAGNPMPNGGLCSIDVTANEAGAILAIVASPPDFVVDGSAVRTRDNRAPTGDAMTRDLGKHSKLVRLWIRDAVLKRLPRDDEDIIVAETKLMTRLEP